MAKLPNPFPRISTTTVTTTKTKNEKITNGVSAGYNGTLIAFVLDESGSMNNAWDSTIEGFNGFVSGQKKTEGEAKLMVNKFEGGNIVDLWGMKDINSAPPLSVDNYRPSGGTNLNDAIGQTIEEIDAHLKTMKKKERPAVMIVIMTDGYENQSRNYKTEEIKELIKLREKKDWGFTFIGADVDAFAASSNYGMNANNTMQYSKRSTSEAFASMSASTTRFRLAKSIGMDTQGYYASGVFTDEERNKSNGGE